MLTIRSNSVRHAPRRHVGPSLQRVRGPIRGLIGVARATRVGDLQRFCVLRRDEFERVASHVHVRDSLLDLRHVAGNTFAARAARCVMRVRLDGRSPRAIG